MCSWHRFKINGQSISLIDLFSWFDSGICVIYGVFMVDSGLSRIQRESGLVSISRFSRYQSKVRGCDFHGVLSLPWDASRRKNQLSLRRSGERGRCFFFTPALSAEVRSVHDVSIKVVALPPATLIQR